MRVNSIETESIDRKGRVVFSSKTTFQLKPNVEDGRSVFSVLKDHIDEHLKFSRDDSLVTIRTNHGIFRRVYRKQRR